MEPSTRTFPISTRSLTELQLSDWQFLVSDETISPDEKAYAERQIGRLKIELAATGSLPVSSDTHVRTPTHGDEPAFLVPGEYEGLSKREFMATQLMAEMVAAKGAYYYANEVAGYAVQHTDALINALNK